MLDVVDHDLSPSCPLRVLDHDELECAAFGSISKSLEPDHVTRPYRPPKIQRIARRKPLAMFITTSSSRGGEDDQRVFWESSWKISDVQWIMGRSETLGVC
jgi:hypothetical protein